MIFRLGNRGCSTIEPTLADIGQWGVGEAMMETDERWCINRKIIVATLENSWANNCSVVMMRGIKALIDWNAIAPYGDEIKAC